MIAADINDAVPASKRTVIMVLADNETFSGLDGCQICTVPTAWTPDDIVLALRGDDPESERSRAPDHQVPAMAGGVTTIHPQQRR